MSVKQFTIPEVTIVTAGTRVPISTSDLLATDIIVTADPSNSGTIVVGDVTVTSNNGQPLSPGESYIISTPTLRGTVEAFVLSDVYVDSDASGDKVRVAYLSRR